MLDIKPYLIVGQILTFLVGMIILWIIAYKPISRIFKQRADKIGADLTATEQARNDVERLKTEYEAQMASLADQTQKTMNQAVKAAQAARDEIVAAARAQGKEIVGKAVEQIGFEKEKAIKELRHQVLDLSMRIAEKTIGEAIDSAKQRRLVEETFAQIKAEK